ncbi:hypothetical protein [uncultured Prevotella sp.]|nr:hypothetical protein [uncultured Prevotella sp.]
MKNIKRKLLTLLAAIVALGAAAELPWENGRLVVSKGDKTKRIKVE